MEAEKGVRTHLSQRSENNRHEEVYKGNKGANPKHNRAVSYIDPMKVIVKLYWSNKIRGCDGLRDISEIDLNQSTKK